jgi:hypothetical protein
VLIFHFLLTQEEAVPFVLRYTVASSIHYLSVLELFQLLTLKKKGVLMSSLDRYGFPDRIIEV